MHDLPGTQAIELGETLYRAWAGTEHLVAAGLADLVLKHDPSPSRRGGAGQPVRQGWCGQHLQGKRGDISAGALPTKIALHRALVSCYVVGLGRDGQDPAP